MVIYGIAAFIYRVFILFIIITFIAGKFFLIGILLALWSVTTQVFIPAGKNVSFLFTSPKLRGKRGKALGVTVMMILVAFTLLFVVPAPSWTRTEGVVWVPEESQVRAGTDGFVARIVAPVDSTVERGQPIIEVEDPFLLAQGNLLEAQLSELQAQFDAAMSTDRVQTAIIREEIVSMQAKLERNRERKEELIIRAITNGRLVVPNAIDLPGRFVRQGQLIAYVIEPKDITARVAIAQDNIAQVRNKTKGVEIMLADWGADPLPASVLREVPAASNRLPTAALGSAGGGMFAVDPRDDQGVTTIGRVFQLELTLPPEIRSAFLGSRIFVRFEHEFEPAGFQIYRAFRQLLLRLLNI
jgi:putative peptide zinc metalloprotease protein